MLLTAAQRLSADNDHERILGPDETNSEPARSVSAEDPMQQTITMLVADDSRTIQKFFEGVVERSTMPIELIYAGDGHTCMVYLRDYAIDLAFIDVHMPQISGMEALARARFTGNKTFVTLMSGWADDERLGLARQIRAYEFLVKPIVASDVMAILATYRRILTPVRTLIVDDSATTRRVVRRVLEDSIFRLDIDEVLDGESALARLAGGDFDLVFLDCNMPGLSGMDTLARLRELGSRTKVIMISASRDPVRDHQALELGAVQVLAKPFYSPEVDCALHHALRLRMPVLGPPPRQLQAGRGVVPA